MPALRLISARFPDDPALDTAVSRALMERVAAGELPETLRLARPGAMVAFGKQDAVSDRYPAAVRAAREAGFEAVLRLAGGRAAVFHENTVELAHAVPAADARAGVHDRFRETADLVAGALRGLGVDAAVGEVPGEYCPGGYSINTRGESKLAGIGQRVIKGGAHIGGVVVAAGGERVRDVLVPVYRELGLDWDPATSGSVAAVAPGTSFDDVLTALRAAYAARYDLVDWELDEKTLRLARHHRPDHLSPQAS